MEESGIPVLRMTHGTAWGLNFELLDVEADFVDIPAR